MIKAVDIHSHFNHNAVHDTDANEIYIPTLDIIKKEYDNAGVVAGCFSSFESVLSDENVIEENAYTKKLIDNTDWAYQWVVLDPRKKESIEQVDYLLSSNKSLGIKLHPVCHKYLISEFGEKAFELAKKHKKFVLVHPSDNCSEVELANRYPDVNLIIAHIGNTDGGSGELGIINAVKSAKNDNIFTDTSGWASLNNNIIEYAVDQIGSEKIFFGTDTYAVASQRGRIEFARIKDIDKENILWNNAINKFGFDIR